MPATLRSWLLCVAAAVTLFDVIALGFHLLAGGCDTVAATAVFRPLATVVLYAMRGQAAAFAVLVAHQACPIRSVRTHTHTPVAPRACPIRTRIRVAPRAAASAVRGCSLRRTRMQVRADVDQLRRLLLAASLVAVALPATAELAEVLRFGAISPLYLHYIPAISPLHLRCTCRCSASAWRRARAAAARRRRWRRPRFADRARKRTRSSQP